MIFSHWDCRWRFRSGTVFGGRGKSGNGLILRWLVVLVFSGCSMIPGQQAPKKNPEQQLFESMMNAFQNRAYESSIELGQQFLARFPQSSRKDEVLIRLGESYQGLVKRDYGSLLEAGVAEPKARAGFLTKHGHYQVWDTRGTELVYNGKVFQQLLQEDPDSHYGDEAAYDLIPFRRKNEDNPDQLQKEISALNEVLNKYPTTSLQPKILFQLGHRYHLLYELYSFSPDPKKRDPAKANVSFQQAEYAYELCLKLPQGGAYSQKAWRQLDMLRQGIRLYQKSGP